MLTKVYSATLGKILGCILAMAIVGLVIYSVLYLQGKELDFTGLYLVFLVAVAITLGHDTSARGFLFAAFIAVLITTIAAVIMRFTNQGEQVHIMVVAVAIIIGFKLGQTTPKL